MHSYVEVRDAIESYCIVSLYGIIRRNQVRLWLSHLRCSFKSASPHDSYVKPSDESLHTSVHFKGHSLKVGGATIPSARTLSDGLGRASNVLSSTFPRAASWTCIVWCSQLRIKLMFILMKAQKSYSVVHVQQFM